MEDQWRPYVPYTRWAPPRVYVTTSFFIPCLGKQSEPKLQARVRRSKNLTSALQKLRIGSVLNVLGLGSPLGGCGPLKKRIWSGHILAKALSNFSDCQAPLNRQQNPTNIKKNILQRTFNLRWQKLFCAFEIFWKCFGNASRPKSSGSPPGPTSKGGFRGSVFLQLSCAQVLDSFGFRVEPNGVCMCSNARCLKTRKRLLDHLGSVYSLIFFECVWRT